LIEVGGEMINGGYQTRVFNLGDLMKLLNAKTRDLRVWSVIAVIILAILLFWAGALVYAYLDDDVNPTPPDQRSMPAPRSY
jgi:hypothetical protein